MSGNTTRLGVGLAHESSAAIVASGLIGCFVIGVAAATLAGDRTRRRRRSIVLSIVSFLLASAAVLASTGFRIAALGCLAAAIGAENAVLGEEGEASVALTYMTGTIVKLRRCLAAALQGRVATGWGSYLLLWTGLLVGATIGAIAYSGIGMAAIWAAAGSAAILALVTKGRRGAGA
jgi:uncharacterized membrane protein YoaK (UPF0700 family)